MNKKIVIVLIVIILIAGICTAFVLNKKTDVKEDKIEEVVASVDQEEKTVEEKDDIKIFSGKDRPIAVMVDNNVNAQPQAAINSAYIVYEIIVEGNETRLMPVFKGVDDDTVVGPIRSVRHYYLDYMKENDAICSHLGQSPQAESDIKTYKIATQTMIRNAWNPSANRLRR